jgi:hypothetical protein
MSVFISYAREDEVMAGELYLELTRAGLEPWMDKPPPPHRGLGLAPGENWRHRLTVEIRRAARVILLLSATSIAKVGFVQNEFRLALDVMNSMPAGARFAIPLLIERCEPPPLSVGAIALADLNWMVLLDVGMQGFVDMLKADMEL